MPRRWGIHTGRERAREGGGGGSEEKSQVKIKRIATRLADLTRTRLRSTMDTVPKSAAHDWSMRAH
jgi:hypothetical protein